MPFAAALSKRTHTKPAMEELCDQALAQLEAPPDLAVLFYSAHHAGAAETISRIANERLRARCFLGCIGEAIIGNGEEVEDAPALSLWLGAWNRSVEFDPFQLVLEETPDGFSLLGWPDSLLTADVANSAALLLGDPVTFPADAALRHVNENYKGLRIMGGMASGARGTGGVCLLLNDRLLDRGAAGVLIQGDLGMRCIVSQGCRPVGRHMVVTRAEENIITEVSGKSPLAQLQSLWQELNERDQRLFQRGLHIGRVINEYQGEFQRGDFLVRNVLGLERESGALGITDLVRVGQTVQFHVRDAATADEDLHALLQIDLSAHEHPPKGALLFSCNGRGTRLFSEPNHDAGVIRAEAGSIPLAGFFAQGELGPIGGQNFIHGFTASVALFED
ncbi:MAG TPA: FIST N-terminal domain-containing protein [Gemmataceae bacterium]